MTGARFGSRIFYGWIVVGLTVVVLLISMGIRSAPTVLIKPLEAEYGWTRTELSVAIMVGLLTTGLAAPFGGALMDRFGPKRIMVAALVAVGLGVGLGTLMDAIWQMALTWGLLAGIGGGISGVLGASVANRWFVERRGLVQGMVGAGNSAGQLIFIPALSAMVLAMGWREATLWLAALAAITVVPVLLLMKDSPAQIGLRPYGLPAGAPPPSTRPDPFREVMGRAVRRPDFWLLAGSFFVCGATSTGIVGTHFIPHAIDHGVPEVRAAGFYALMGSLNFVGALASGVLTDRYDPRRLLAIYYSLRGISLLFLPFVTESNLGLTGWAILFGLDYIATVPPTTALAADLFGRRNVGLIYGWVFCAHQLGAAAFALGGGWVHDAFDAYTIAFIAAGVTAVIGAGMALGIERRTPVEAIPAAAGT